MSFCKVWFDQGKRAFTIYSVRSIIAIRDTILEKLSSDYLLPLRSQSRVYHFHRFSIYLLRTIHATLLRIGLLKILLKDGNLCHIIDFTEATKHVLILLKPYQYDRNYYPSKHIYCHNPIHSTHVLVYFLFSLRWVVFINGWIKIPNIVINHPINYHDGKIESNEYCCI